MLRKAHFKVFSLITIVKLHLAKIVGVCFGLTDFAGGSDNILMFTTQK